MPALRSPAALRESPGLQPVSRALCVTDLIGNTPLLDVTSLGTRLSPGVRLFAKLEGFSPGGCLHLHDRLRCGGRGSDRLGNVGGNGGGNIADDLRYGRHALIRLFIRDWCGCLDLRNGFTLDRLGSRGRFLHFLSGSRFGGRDSFLHFLSGRRFRSRGFDGACFFHFQ